MARFRHEIELAPLPRPWFERAVRLLFEVVEELRFDRDGRLIAGTGTVDAVRLTDGEHLTDGATYEITFGLEGAPVGVEVELLAWKPSGVTRLRVSSQVWRFAIAGTIELHRDQDRLRTVRATGSGNGDRGWARLLRLSWDAEADLHRWWEQAASRRRERSAPPISATLKAGPGKARFNVTCRKSSKGWSVRPALALTGRSLFRPFGLLLLFVRPGLASDYRASVKEFAKYWQRAVPWIASSPASGPLLLRDEKTVTALPRPWSDDFARAMHTELEGLPFEKGRLVTEADETDADDTERVSTVVELVKGRHLKSGARYRVTRQPSDDTQSEVHLASLDMTGESLIEVRTISEYGQGSWSAALRTIEHPETLTASGEYAVSGDWEALLRSSWRLDAGLRDTPRLRCHLEHPFFLVKLHLTARPSAKGTWKVTPELTVEGREAGRPLLQLAHLLDHGKLTAYYAEQVAEAATEWNDRFTDPAAQEPADVAAAVLHDLLTPRGRIRMGRLERQRQELELWAEEMDRQEKSSKNRGH